MKEIAIISGKGGTGKTSITAALAFLASDLAIIADCDVDAADMHLLLQPDFANKTPFYSGKIAEINPGKCISCTKCAKVCHFDAIDFQDAYYSVNSIKCEGCGYCFQVCPYGAISMKDSYTGNYYLSKTRLGNQLVHAALNIGAENSGKLVTAVRNNARKLAEQENTPFIIIDGTPGVGCPVIASITGTNHVIMVTEPSISGLHDLERVHQLCQHMNIPTSCIINKAHLNEDINKKIITTHIIVFTAILLLAVLFIKVLLVYFAYILLNFLSFVKQSDLADLN